MKEDIFRPKGEKERRGRFDAFTLRSERTERLVSHGLIGAFAIFVLLIALFPYAESVEARGQVIPESGVVRIASDRSGIIHALPVREHGSVEAGEIIAVIRGDVHGDGRKSHARENLENLQSQVESVEYKNKVETAIAEQVLAHLISERGEVSQRIARARSNLRFAERKAELAEEGFSRAQPLAEEKLISRHELGRLEEQVLNARMALTEATQYLADSEERSHEVEQEIARAKGQLVVYEQQTRIEKSRIQQEILSSEYSESSNIVSPVAGRLTYSNFRMGESVKQGDVIANVTPVDAHLRAMAFIPSRSIANLKVGNDVKVMVDSHPYQQYGVLQGVLADVSLAPVEPLQEVRQPNETISYRVLVDFKVSTFNGKPLDSAIRPGEALSVEISGERKPVFKWVLDYLVNSSSKIVR